MKRLVKILFGAILLLVMTVDVQAGFVMSGSIPFSNSSGGAGTVNYAVYKTNGSDWAAAGELNAAGVASKLVSGPTPAGGPVSTTAYVYLYEVVNSSVTDFVTNFSLQIDTSQVIDIGYIKDTVFGAISPPSATVVTNTAAVPPTATSPTLFGDEWFYNFNSPAPPSLGPGSMTSTLLYVASNGSPLNSFFGVGTAPPANNNQGAVPVPTPLPAGFSLIASALPGLLAVGWLRRRSS
jgi:hypothetical protein